MSATYSISGLDDAKAKLTALGKKAAGKDVRTSLRAGAKVIAAGGEAIAPRRSGLMAKTIVVRGGRKGMGTRGITAVTVTYNKKAYAALRNPSGSEKGFYADAADVGHFAGRRIGSQAVNQASKSVDWSKDKIVRGAQNVALYHRLSRAAGRKWIPGAMVLARAAAMKTGAALEKFASTLRDLLAERSS